MFTVKTIESYQAADGQIFSTYEEAEAHNAKIAAHGMGKEITIFDEEGEILLIEEAVNWYEKVYFFVVHSQKGAKWMMDYLHSKGCYDLDEIELKVCYHYLNEEDRWVSPQDELDRLNFMWKGLVKFEEAHY